MPPPSLTTDHMENLLPGIIGIRDQFRSREGGGGAGFCPNISAALAQKLSCFGQFLLVFSR